MAELGLQTQNGGGEAGCDTEQGLEGGGEGLKRRGAHCGEDELGAGLIGMRPENSRRCCGKQADTNRLALLRRVGGTETDIAPEGNVWVEDLKGRGGNCSLVGQVVSVPRRWRNLRTSPHHHHHPN